MCYCNSKLAGTLVILCISWVLFILFFITIVDSIGFIMQIGNCYYIFCVLQSFCQHSSKLAPGLKGPFTKGIIELVFCFSYIPLPHKYINICLLRSILHASEEMSCSPQILLSDKTILALSQQNTFCWISCS